ncbi:MAG: sarcosine oxidase subunit gamma [Proteobacteria bacterium]|nr:sarcosine oxidase subunit gamma [Pseudomonadota bacterium]
MRSLIGERQWPALSATAYVHVLPPAQRFVLRGDAAARAAAESALGVPVPQQACRAGTDGARAALWLGPDEWLLVAPAADQEAQGALEHALGGLAHSLVEVSHRQLGLLVSGPEAERLLNAGCPLDLDIGPFPVGMCTRTMLSKAEVVLWRTGTQEFRLEVWRSFAPYVTAYLAEAARGI